MWLSGKESICLPMQESGLLVTQSSLNLCNPMDCSLPGSSVHGLLKARILEWVAVPFSKGSSWPRDWTQVSCIVSRCFTIWTTREAHQCKRRRFSLWVEKILGDKQQQARKRVKASDTFHYHSHANIQSLFFKSLSLRNKKLYRIFCFPSLNVFIC